MPLRLEKGQSRAAEEEQTAQIRLDPRDLRPPPRVPRRNSLSPATLWPRPRGRPSPHPRTHPRHYRQRRTPRDTGSPATGGAGRAGPPGNGFAWGQNAPPPPRPRLRAAHARDARRFARGEAPPRRQTAARPQPPGPLALARLRPGAARVGPGGDPSCPFDPGSQRQQTGGPWANVRAHRSRQAHATAGRASMVVQPAAKLTNLLVYSPPSGPPRFAWFSPGTPQGGALRSIPLADNGLQAAPMLSAYPKRSFSERPASGREARTQPRHCCRCHWAAGARGASVRASAPAVATSGPHEGKPAPEMWRRKCLACNWMRSAPGIVPRPSNAVNQSEHQFAPEKSGSPTRTRTLPGRSQDWAAVNSWRASADAISLSKWPRRCLS